MTTSSQPTTEAETQRVTVRLPRDLLDEVDEACDAHGFMNRSEYIRYALRQSSITQ